MERVAMGKGGEGKMGRGQWGGGKGERGGEGEKKGQEGGKMECLSGMRLQSFLTNGYFVYQCNAGPPS